MNYQKVFPKILESSYPNCKDISTSNLPKVKVKSFIFGERIISLPFLDVIEVKDIEKEDVSETLNFEVRLSEFYAGFFSLKKKLIEFGFKENFVKAHIVSELTSEEDFWKRFHKHTRNDIRKAEKSGLKIKKINSLIELKKFYFLYLKEMKNFGTPQHSFKFFENCFNLLKKDFCGFNCYKRKKLIASVILFINNDYGYVSFNVSDSNFRNFRPNDFLYGNLIRWAIKNKIKFFDLGQVDLNPTKNSREENLLKFKRKWLGKEYRRIYFTKGFDYKQKKKESLKKFRRIWRHLPTPIIKIIGPRVVSRMGI
jgi:lipid II:glycine glycyltransferase (peptidoglycan interpeptide bridge formation enzyme)